MPDNDNARARRDPQRNTGARGKMVNWQLIFVKDRNAIPMMRDWIVEESARLRASDVAPEWHLDPGLPEVAE